MKKHPSIISDTGFHILDESAKYILGHTWEFAKLHVKKSEEDIDLFKFYGDPECGLILDDKDCCLVGGDILFVWKDKKTTIIETEDFKSIFRIRRKDERTVEVLTDPWLECSAKWEIDIDSLGLKKVCDFDKYKEMPYQDEIEW